MQYRKKLDENLPKLKIWTVFGHSILIMSFKSQRKCSLESVEYSYWNEFPSKSTNITVELDIKMTRM